MIPAEVVHRVFFIRRGDAVGTAFAIDVDNRQYLVTAKHVVGTESTTPTVQIFAQGNWVNLPLRLIGHASSEGDVSVLATDEPIVPPNFPLASTSEGLTYGQEVFFLGFPYGFTGQFSWGPMGFPIPFVKRATVSLFSGPHYLLDGHNNPGFSGGPVVFARPGERVFRVAGVISGYRAVSQPVFAGGSPTPLSFAYNTGIIVCEPIEQATQLIQQNPAGRPLT